MALFAARNKTVKAVKEKWTTGDDVEVMAKLVAYCSDQVWEDIGFVHSSNVLRTHKNKHKHTQTHTLFLLSNNGCFTSNALYSAC